MEISNIYKKFHKVMYECNKFDQSGSYNNYGKYSTIDDILKKMNVVLTKYGLISTINSKLVDIKDTKTSKGNPELMVIVEVTIRIRDIDDSKEQLEIVCLGSGTDPTKAQMNAIKYGYILSLCSIG